MGTQTAPLGELILAALDSAILESENDVADQLLSAMESLCGNNERDPRLIMAYRRIYPNHDMSEANLQSTLTCPRCGFRKEETMPTDACQYFYECMQCKTLLKPKPGDCCVFCSFGSVACPPIQQQRDCC